MSGTTHIFLGIIIVGLIMTMKVVMDGLHAVSELNDKIAGLRASTRLCETQIEEEDNKNQEMESELAELKSVVEQLEQQEKDINRQIQSLRTDLDGRNKFKIDS